ACRACHAPASRRIFFRRARKSCTPLLLAHGPDPLTTLAYAACNESSIVCSRCNAIRGEYFPQHINSHFSEFTCVFTGYVLFVCHCNRRLTLVFNHSCLP